MPWRSNRRHVLDLLAVEETRAAARQVRDALTAQLILEIAREHADRMGEDGDVREAPAASIQPPDRLRHRPGLGPRVRRHDHGHRPISGAARSDEVGLCREIRVPPDERGRAIQDLLEGSAVVRERKPPAAETAADVLDLGVAPAVDRLIRVADDGHVPEVIGRQQPDEVELDPVGVLELVDEQVAEALAAAPAKLGHTLERIDHLEDEIVEVAQPLCRERLLVSAIHEMQDLDRLQLSLGGLARRGVTRGIPVTRVELESALSKALRGYAPALELEQKAQPGAQEVVEVVDAQTREGVRVEGCSFPGAQARHQPLLEQPLPSLIEHAKLAWRPDQVGELVEEAGADAVECPDPGAVEDLGSEVGTARPELLGDPGAELVGGPVVERDREDLAGRHAMLDQPAEALGRGCGLAGSAPRRDEKSAIRTCMRGHNLLGAQRPRGSGDHSGGAPPYGQIAECGHEPKRVMQVPARSRGAGSKWPPLIREMA